MPRRRDTPPQPYQLNDPTVNLFAFVALEGAHDHGRQDGAIIWGEDGFDKDHSAGS